MSNMEKECLSNWVYWTGFEFPLKDIYAAYREQTRLQIDAIDQIVKSLEMIPREFRNEWDNSLQIIRKLEKRTLSWLSARPALRAWLSQIKYFIQKALKENSDVSNTLLHIVRFAVAGAFYEGKDIQMTFPWRNGSFSLPGFSVALETPLETPAESLTVTIRQTHLSVSKQGGIELGRIQKKPGSEKILIDNGRWLEMVKIETPGLPLIADFCDPCLVENLDPNFPYNQHANIATTEERELWEARLQAAVKLIARVHPKLSSELHAIVSVIVPLQALENYHISCTIADAAGAIWCSLTSTDALAEALVHEYGHTKLHLLMKHIELLAEDCPQSASFFSPWRPDPRPIEGLLHGAFVAIYVTRFWEILANLRQQPDDFSKWGRAAARLSAAVNELLALPYFTSAGQTFLKTFVEESQLLSQSISNHKDFLKEDQRIKERRDEWLKIYGNLH